MYWRKKQIYDTHTHAHTRTHTHTHRDVYTYIYIFIYTYTFTCPYTYIEQIDLFVFIYIYTYVYTHTFAQCSRLVTQPNTPLSDSSLESFFRLPWQLQVWKVTLHKFCMESRRWLELCGHGSVHCLPTCVWACVLDLVFGSPSLQHCSHGFLLGVESRWWLFSTTDAVQLVLELGFQYVDQKAASGAVCVPKFDSLTRVLPRVHHEAYAKRIRQRK